MILFHVYEHSETSRMHVMVMANDREEAKRLATQHLLGDPNRYVVSPLTRPGDVIQFNLSAHTRVHS